MQCSFCDAVLPRKAKHCQRCGQRLDFRVRSAAPKQTAKQRSQDTSDLGRKLLLILAVLLILAGLGILKIH
jgi:ribosomal protein L40E